MNKILIIILCILPLTAFAALLENIPSPVVQPDGTVLNLLASGDEFANRLHDANGYTIIQSTTDGFFYYATLQSGEPAPSQYLVGSVDPSTTGIQKHINISKAAYDAKRAFMQVPNQRNNRAPNTGTVNNLNVFIRFSDQDEFTISRELYNERFNTVGDDAISLRNYFQKASYNQLDYVTHHYPVCQPGINLSYQDSHPRSYFMPYNAITNPNGYMDSNERAYREQTMLAAAINYIAAEVPTDLNIDADNDGAVDNVCFIIRGPHTAWADLLWAHRWALYYTEAYINGKQVWDFTFQPEDQNSVRTLCHEMFHSVGAPDLYHYTFNGVTPTGCWDIMESGNGHMGMYMKFKYGGWLDTIPSASNPGTYTLNPITSATNNVYKIAIPGSNSQYLVLEYRKRGSDVFEAELPGSGLLIYRINTNYDGNADGPPDEVYVYRPNGSNTVNGQIFEAAFSADVWRTDFNAYTNPAARLTNGNTFQVNINSISAVGETISFTVSPTTSSLAPVISAISPVSGSMLANTEFTVSASVSAPNSSVMMVEFSVNGAPAIVDETAPYSAVIDAATLGIGLHDILVTAYSANGLQTQRTSTVKIIDPTQQNWFSWLTPTPEWAEFGRGAVPIKVAVDFDLGDQEYLVKGIKFSALPDVWGQPALSGLFNARINRFTAGAITEQTLIELGSIYNLDYEQDFVFTVADTTRISGEVALILDCYEYQNILFDENAPCGHSWLTEPDRPWTDALARGMLGSAALQLLLQAPVVEGEDNYLPPVQLSLANYPNPFSGNTTINYTAKASTPLSIEIYNLKGQKVKTLFSGIAEKSVGQLSWNGRDDNDNPVGSGVYYYRLNASGSTKTAKMLLIK